MAEGQVAQVESFGVPVTINSGRKDDQGKCRLDLIPMDALWEVGKVYTKGAGIYGDWNWANGLKYSRVIAALLRHLFKWCMGETYDDKDGQHHLTSVVWCGLSLLHFDLNQDHFKEFDDRRAGWNWGWKNETKGT